MLIDSGSNESSIRVRDEEIKEEEWENLLGGTRENRWGENRNVRSFLLAERWVTQSQCVHAHQGVYVCVLVAFRGLFQSQDRRGGSESDRRVVKELIFQHDPLVEKGWFVVKLHNIM